jgi:hypothetical protein
LLEPAAEGFLSVCQKLLKFFKAGIANRFHFHGIEAHLRRIGKQALRKPAKLVVMGP